MLILDFLLENGGSSVKYRTRRDILKDDVHSDEMNFIQKEILCKYQVRKLLDNQHEDGWIGNELHGGRGKGIDSSISYLVNRGVEKDHPAMKKAVAALLSVGEDKTYRTTFRGGSALDEGGRGGNEAVKAGVLAELGAEDNEIVQSQISISLQYLQDSLSYKTFDDFSIVNRKGTRYYTQDAHFPGANHLNLLSITERWRSPENFELLKRSLCHCMKIMMKTNDNITFKTGSHFVGPFNFNWKVADFDITDIQQDSYALVWWLRSLYKLSQIGVICDVPELKTAYDYLYQLFITQDIIHLQTDLSLKRFRDIFSIEDSWKNENSMNCDIMFWCAITLHNAGYNVQNIELK